MALIRGANGLCPCPVCLVPGDKLHDPSMEWELRDMDATRELVKAAKSGKQSQWEPILKEKGLRKIEVSLQSLSLLLKLIYNLRMPFGMWHSLIHSKQFHGIGCMVTHMVSVGNIFGPYLEIIFQMKVMRLSNRLMKGIQIIFQLFKTLSAYY